MDYLINLLTSLFSKYKCLIYTSFGSEDYFRVVNKLTSHGVQFRTRTFNYHSSQHFGRVDHTQYDIYVRPEDEHKAQQAIHSR
jgi:hypothetical protein